MALNPNITQLDYNQVIPRTFDQDNDATRVVVAGGSEFEIALDQAEDSVAVRSTLDSDHATANSAAAVGQLLLLDITGRKELQVLVKIISAITGTCSIQLEISPEDSGSTTWFTVGAPVAVTGAVDLIGTIANTLARRARLRIVSNNITIGSAEVYLMARG